MAECMKTMAGTVGTLVTWTRRSRALMIFIKDIVTVRLGNSKGYFSKILHFTEINHEDKFTKFQRTERLLQTTTNQRMQPLQLDDLLQRHFFHSRIDEKNEKSSRNR